MKPRDKAIGMLKTYGLIWSLVRHSTELEGMTPEMRKDVATSIFIQIMRGR